MHKHHAKWKVTLPWLIEDSSDEEEDETPAQEVVTQAKVVGVKEEEEEQPDIDDADTRRWNPPRRTSLQKAVTIPEPTPEDDDEYDELGRPHSPRTPRIVQSATPLVSEQSRRRRNTEGSRRRSIAFTAEERWTFIEFLADHPWVSLSLWHSSRRSAEVFLEGLDYCHRSRGLACRGDHRFSRMAKV